MTAEILERLKRSAMAKPNGNASNVRAHDLLALIVRNEKLEEAMGVLILSGERLADECDDEKRCEEWAAQRDTVNDLLRS